MTLARSPQQIARLRQAAYATLDIHDPPVDDQGRELHAGDVVAAHEEELIGTIVAHLGEHLILWAGPARWRATNGTVIVEAKDCRWLRSFPDPRSFAMCYGNDFAKLNPLDANGVRLQRGDFCRDEPDGMCGIIVAAIATSALVAAFHGMGPHPVLCGWHTTELERLGLPRVPTANLPRPVILPGIVRPLTARERQSFHQSSLARASETR